jgi:hypothetical protein
MNRRKRNSFVKEKKKKENRSVIVLQSRRLPCPLARRESHIVTGARQIAKLASGSERESISCPGGSATGDAAPPATRIYLAQWCW